MCLLHYTRTDFLTFTTADNIEPSLKNCVLSSFSLSVSANKKIFAVSFPSCKQLREAESEKINFYTEQRLRLDWNRLLSAVKKELYIWELEKVETKTNSSQLSHRRFMA
jgi:hypothetical protein